MFGWRATLAVICFSFSLSSFIRAFRKCATPVRLHSPREYLAVFKGRSPVLFAEACSLVFVFAAIGNLIPFRMAELSRPEGLISDSCISGVPSALSLVVPCAAHALLRRQQDYFASSLFRQNVSCLTLAVLPLRPCSAGYGS